MEHTLPADRDAEAAAIADPRCNCHGLTGCRWAQPDRVSLTGSSGMLYAMGESKRSADPSEWASESETGHGIRMAFLLLTYAARANRGRTVCVLAREESRSPSTG
jgi:hypothetical protein